MLLAIGALTAAVENSDEFWSEWSEATFARAVREDKFVVVSLQSWRCKWCHVMKQETWSKVEVRAFLKDHFILVYVHQDSRPDISQRYERRGWPATIIFGPDGKEIAKLRGCPRFSLGPHARSKDDGRSQADASRSRLFYASNELALQSETQSPLVFPHNGDNCDAEEIDFP